MRWCRVVNAQVHGAAQVVEMAVAPHRQRPKKTNQHLTVDLNLDGHRQR
jgi:hypothetical protein